ncbi:MerR family transcriptional regulator [Nocardia sp. NBC_01388]|uniref:MerR family transcriptional regulator n=1 Tax=Nocardia sp. NBC_01388 TaxID=2903596 RepID=UPI0032432EF4
MDYTIDELARVADTTVRSVRVYHERGLLPSPEVRGRTGYYGPDHLNRLQTISRLLSRGMKLNGIRELLEAWDRGDGLADVLGVTDQAGEEVSNATAEDTELIEPISLDSRRPADSQSHALVAQLVETGVAPSAAFDFIERLSSDCDQLAARYADKLFDHMATRDPGQPERAIGDFTSMKTDREISRLIASRAVSTLIDQALTRHAELPTTS